MDRRNPSSRNASKTTSPSNSSSLRLKIVIVARKADGLILSGVSLDPLMTQSDSLSLQAHASRIVHAVVSSRNVTNGTIDDGGEHFCYNSKDSVVVVCATIGRDIDAQASTYGSSVAAEFMGTNGHLVANCTRDYEISSFNERLRAIANREDGFARLTSELEAVHDAVADNVRQMMVRGDKISEIGDIAEDLRENANKYQIVAKKVDLHALWVQYKPVVIVAGVALLVILLRIFL